MKTKIVYCLVSDNEDYYYEQLLISLCSLRKHNPDTIVEVVCDNDTYATLHDTRSTIYDYDIIVTPVETPCGWQKKEKSRYIKTNLRKLINGNYLFVDTDTVICSSLDFIDNFSFDIAAVKDSHVERPLPRFSKCQHETEHWIWGNAKRASINIEGLWHFNSGVMYVRDTKVAYELYDRWSKHYSEQLKYGVKVDQLPLLLSNHEMNNIISPLDSRMNCQVIWDEGKAMLKEAKIIHYFPGQGHYILSSPWILDPIKETGKIPCTIQRIIDNPQKFFIQDSAIVYGDATKIVKSPLLGPYSHGNKIIKILEKTIVLCLILKSKLRRIVSI